MAFTLCSFRVCRDGGGGRRRRLLTSAGSQTARGQSRVGWGCEQIVSTTSRTGWRYSLGPLICPFSKPNTEEGAGVRGGGVALSAPPTGGKSEAGFPATRTRFNNGGDKAPIISAGPRMSPTVSSQSCLSGWQAKGLIYSSQDGSAVLWLPLPSFLNK